jgi:triacylglycerol lipase
MTRYPLVFVHGIANHDRTAKNKSWGRIPDVLRKAGLTVFFGNTDAWGNYESNAEILKNTIDQIVNGNFEKVNIIAHSKGGLDSRYAIWKYNLENKVASLTTISTPHHGSEIADFIYKQKITHSYLAKQALMLFSKFYGDENPNLYSLIHQLTTDNMKMFNDTVLLDKQVF